MNLKPLFPGHVLVVPLRTECLSLSDLTPEENKDYFATLQVVHQFISDEFHADSVNVAIQDGPEAGQTVPHLHTHIIPRPKVNNIGDKVYDKLDAWTFEEQLAKWNERRSDYASADTSIIKRELIVPDVQREPRSMDEMSAEAHALSQKLNLFLEQNPKLKEYY